MKYKIIFSILGMILLLGASVYAGGVVLSSRDAVITTEQKIALTEKGIDEKVIVNSVKPK
jgi:hypothetical protein